MIGKLIIIGIIIATIAILVPNASKLFQSVPSSIDTVKGKIDQVAGSKGIINDSKLAIKELGLGANSILNTSSTNNNLTSVYQLAPQYVTQQNYTGQVFEKTGNTCQISVPGLAQTINGIKQLTGIIQLDQCTSNVGDPVQVTKLTAKPNSPPVDVPSGLTISPYSNNGNTVPTGATSSNTPALPTLPSYYQTVQLTTINQGNSAMLNFDDTSGQTKSVIVTMRNSNTVLFTGTFYSSKFSTEVKDVPNTPHIIEMTIDNTIYGTLHASVYAPSNMQNSTITGILSQ
ncbi:hypothetical protein [Candidatus Nitrosotalea okcheonensis]|uniref:Uncharacterized protein n=1 Tax=Candidatus Nitrosotalea okcheonensis TaxID=1903276 RepID=A0A2H1FH47_9ARCH|nr:hypothetical protein [Candidatus Nitrosotalea okcheonensis]SMH72096.1 conserved exported protein of unknown function [Candidatus Nitrosotalea okcheonensis]